MDDLEYMKSSSVSDVPIDEFAETTKSGTAKPGLRMYVLGLTTTSLLLVMDVRNHYAQCLAEQWAAGSQ